MAYPAKNAAAMSSIQPMGFDGWRRAITSPTAATIAMMRSSTPSNDARRSCARTVSRHPATTSTAVKPPRASEARDGVGLRVNLFARTRQNLGQRPFRQRYGNEWLEVDGLGRREPGVGRAVGCANHRDESVDQRAAGFAEIRVVDLERAWCANGSREVNDFADLRPRCVDRDQQRLDGYRRHRERIARVVDR